MWNAKHLIHLGSNGRGTSLLSKDSNLAQILVAKEDGIYTYKYSSADYINLSEFTCQYP